MALGYKLFFLTARLELFFNLNCALRTSLARKTCLNAHLKLWRAVNDMQKKSKKKKKKRHRHLAVKFRTTPKHFSPPKLQLLVSV